MTSNDSGINFPSTDYVDFIKERVSDVFPSVCGDDDFDSHEYLACSSHDDVDYVSKELPNTLSILNKSQINNSRSSQDCSTNSLVILSSSCPTSADSTYKETSLPNEKVDEQFISKLIHDAYQQADNEACNIQTSLSHGEHWEPYAQSSPCKDFQESQHHKIIMRELSFDELKDVQGVDLMAPVFLAVTDEPDESFQDLRRKAKSIEDLCSTTCSDEYDNLFRHRSKSEVPLRGQSKRMLKPSSDTNFYELTYDDEFEYADLEEIKLRLTSLTMSNISEGVSRQDSISSDQYNESIDDELEDQALIDVFVNHGMYDSVEDKGCRDGSSRLDISGSMYNEDSVRETIDVKEESVYDNEQKRSSSLTMFNETGFWEYPNSPSPTLSQSSRHHSINTAPTSSMVLSNPNDRFIVVNVTGQQRVVDMKLIEPYLKILSHGGHHSMNGEHCVLVVFTAYYLPSKSIEKYNIIMEQLFYYFVHAVDLLVTEAYEIVFFNSPTDKNMPSRTWVKQCYNLVNYRLKKNLRRIYFVHQSLWLKAVLKFSQFFVSAKFRRKICLVRNIQNLKRYIPLEYIFIPPEIYINDKRFQ